VILASQHCLPLVVLSDKDQHHSRWTEVAPDGQS